MTQQNLLQGEFDPTVPTRIVFGNGKVDSIKDEVQKLGGKKVLVLSGQSRRRWWFDSDPLCTRQRSSPVLKGCAPSVVTALSVAMRVWPMAWLPATRGTPNRDSTSAGSPASL